MNRLAGRRVVVTGGARGLGAAIARAFTAEAASVVVLDRDADAGARLAAEVHGRSCAVDPADPRAMQEAMDRAIAWLGGIDVLVNDAGAARYVPLLEAGPEELDDAVALPMRTMLTATRVAARAMVGYRGPGQDCAGKVVNVASAGCTTGGGQAHYAAARSTVEALTRAAAHELGPHGITVNCLCPGYVGDEGGPFARDRQAAAAWSALSPLGRPAQSRDIARAAVFLASSDSDYLTGDALHVTGGMALH